MLRPVPASHLGYVRPTKLPHNFALQSFLVRRELDA